MIPHVIVADDHSMVRKGIKLLLMTQLHCKNVYEADSCNTLMNELKKGGCTHIVLDLIMMDGTALEIVPVIKKLYPETRIMIFSMQLGEIYAEAFRQYGIYYYLNKTSSEEDITTYMKWFLNNDTYPGNYKAVQSSSNPFSVLAPRELEILHYLLNGHKTQDIANTLNLSASTVSTIKKRIFEKTASSNIAELIEMASLHYVSFDISNSKNKNT